MTFYKLNKSLYVLCVCDCKPKKYNFNGCTYIIKSAFKTNYIQIRVICS